MTAAAAARAASSAAPSISAMAAAPASRVGLWQTPEGLHAGRARGGEHLVGAAEGLCQRAARARALHQRDRVVGGVVELVGARAARRPTSRLLIALGRAEQPAGDGGERRVAPLVGGSWIDQWRSKTRNAQLVSKT